MGLVQPERTRPQLAIAFEAAEDLDTEAGLSFARYSVAVQLCTRHWATLGVSFLTGKAGITPALRGHVYKHSVSPHLVPFSWFTQLQLHDPLSGPSTSQGPLSSPL